MLSRWSKPGEDASLLLSRGKRDTDCRMHRWICWWPCEQTKLKALIGQGHDRRIWILYIIFEDTNIVDWKTQKETNECAVASRASSLGSLTSPMWSASKSETTLFLIENFVKDTRTPRSFKPIMKDRSRCINVSLVKKTFTNILREVLVSLLSYVMNIKPSELTKLCLFADSWSSWEEQ